MQIPTFPECDHDLVKPLIHQSDYALVSSLQRSPTEGKYFTALFCRYSPVVYSLIRHSARSPVQADYLFALTWRHILNELGGIDLAPFKPKGPEHNPNQPSELTESDANADSKDAKGPEGSESSESSEFSLQGWLINLTAAHINQIKLPDVESIHYVLKDAPPPLWCYTERAMENLMPKHRLMIVMAETFEWSDTRISAYLQAEGERVAPQDIRAERQLAYQSLERAIPADMRAIYLDQTPPVVASPDEAGLMTIEFDEVDLSP
ncbi:MAG: sigma-70 family RNA polymerase sigma factor [Cyanobacteria bacterium J06560_6]